MVNYVSTEAVTEQDKRDTTQRQLNFLEKRERADLQDFQPKKRPRLSVEKNFFMLDNQVPFE